MHTKTPVHNISSLAAASGLTRRVISVLVEEHGIETSRRGNNVIIEPHALPRLLAIVRRYPGVRDDFADAG